MSFVQSLVKVHLCHRACKSGPLSLRLCHHMKEQKAMRASRAAMGTMLRPSDTLIWQSAVCQDWPDLCHYTTTTVHEHGLNCTFINPLYNFWLKIPGLAKRRNRLYWSFVSCSPFKVSMASRMIPPRYFIFPVVHIIVFRRVNSTNPYIFTMLLKSTSSILYGFSYSFCHVLSLYCIQSSS